MLAESRHCDRTRTVAGAIVNQGERAHQEQVSDHWLQQSAPRRQQDHCH
jgi:hypothetical protein